LGTSDTGAGSAVRADGGPSPIAAADGSPAGATAPAATSLTWRVRVRNKERNRGEGNEAKPAMSFHDAFSRGVGGTDLASPPRIRAKSVCVISTMNDKQSG